MTDYNFCWVYIDQLPTPHVKSIRHFRLMGKDALQGRSLMHLYYRNVTMIFLPDNWQCQSTNSPISLKEWWTVCRLYLYHQFVFNIWSYKHTNITSPKPMHINFVVCYWTCCNLSLIHIELSLLVPLGDNAALNWQFAIFFKLTISLR